jgi:hypothetical protein
MKLNANLITMLALLSAGSSLTAGEWGKEVVGKEVIEADGPFVSGTFSFNYNTHFISYGADVWGNGGSTFNDSLFNPSLELKFALPNDYYMVLGTWWDVNGNIDPSAIGGRIQEVDLWTGVGKDFGFVDAKLLYQQWIYASDTEHIVDLVLGFEAPLNPSFTVHYRPDQGAAFGDEGFFFVGGIAPGFDVGPVAVTIPVNVAFATDNFHGGDSGFGYASAGVQASYPLPVPDGYGDWSLTAGYTYYHTSDDVIPNNPADDFFTGTAGISIGF